MNSERTDYTGQTWIQLVTFRLGREHYGIPVSKVKEIIRPMEACPIPGMAGPVEGVINLRGEIIPVLRIHEVLGVKAGSDQIARKQRVIILDSGEGGFGVTVDEVLEVVKIDEAQIKHSPGVSADHRCEQAILGIVESAGHMVIVLDPAILVSESLEIEELVGR
jgi:purine-binding chemotaxis protein CheW